MPTLLFLLVLSTSFCFAQSDTSTTSSTQVAQKSPLEAEVATKIQAIYNQDKQQLFHVFHSRGEATAVIVSDVKITQWKNGVDTEQPSDILQFAVHYTLYWSSILHHGDGYTEATSVYAIDSDSGKIACVGNQVIKSNGSNLKGDVPKGLTGLIAKYAVHFLL